MSTTHLILYTDGSFKNGKAGWGVHGYEYNVEPMTSKANLKAQPTDKGYKDVPTAETCTVVKYIDIFGPVVGTQTNNTAELLAVIKAMEFALTKKSGSLSILLDSDYVRKSIESYLPKWIESKWVKSDGAPVKNRDLWETYIATDVKWKATGRTLKLIKVKGHSGEFGNDRADMNALRGRESIEDRLYETDGIVVNKVKKIQLNPLILESRLLFPTKEPADTPYYYTYNLGTLHSFGIVANKDSAKEKLAKADLILGRRIAEATFSVYKADEPEEYLDLLKNLHRESMERDEPELAIIHLGNACNAKQRQQIESLGLPGLLEHSDIQTISTPTMDLVSRTLNPPRLANDAVLLFSDIKRTLDNYLDSKLGKAVTVIDITDSFYDTVGKGEKACYRLSKSITSTTKYIDLNPVIAGHKTLVRLVLTIDLPSRNQLNRISPNLEKLDLLISMTGPSSYTYSVVFKTKDGSAIYTSPYTQLITRI